MEKISQEKLGLALGITFQQIQKYEKGTNRIGASRLQKIAETLNVPVSFFFEDAPGGNGAETGSGMAEASSSSYVVDFLSSSEGIELNRAFVRITNSSIRRPAAGSFKGQTSWQRSQPNAQPLILSLSASGMSPS